MTRNRTDERGLTKAVTMLVVTMTAAIFIAFCTVRGCQPKALPPPEQYQIDSINDPGPAGYGYSKQ